MKELRMTQNQADAIKNQAISLINRGRNPESEYSIVLLPAIKAPAFIRTKETAEAIDDTPGPFYTLLEIANIEPIEK